MPRLDFAYVRLNDPGGGLIEMVRHEKLRDLAAEPRGIGQTLTTRWALTHGNGLRAQETRLEMEAYRASCPCDFRQ